MEPSSNIKNQLAKAIGEIIGWLLLVWAKAWCLSLCVSWFVPVQLAMWQWMVVVVTISALIWQNNGNN
jgi:hypothetical protein